MSAVVTVIPVLYRDLGNFKVHGTLIADGAMTDAEWATLRDSLDSGEYYLPLQIGLDHLGVELSRYSPAAGDHPWHEMNVYDITTADAASFIGSGQIVHVGPVGKFVESVAEARAAGWDPEKYSPDA